MLFLFAFLGTVTLYYYLPAALSQRLPASLRRPLRAAHQASAALVLAAVLVTCVWWNLRIRYPALFALVVAGSGLAAALRVRLALVAGPWARLTRFQAGLTPWLLPGVFVWGAYRAAGVAYWDATVSVEVATSTGWFSEATTTWVTLSHARGLLFDERLGDAHATPAYPSPPDRYPADFYRADWWAGVRGVSVNADSLTGAAWHPSGSYSFRVVPPGPGPAPPVAPAALPPPAADEHVYTHVEHMPRVLERPGDVVPELSRALAAVLVLPPTAREGRVAVRLVVDKAGEIRHVRIVHGLNAPTDSAVLAAAAHLPRLVPGYLNGHPRNVALTLPDVVVAKPRAWRGHATW
ncbi:energy transducer TonB [Hymenobacter arizonensis]|uniref:TonB protein C-terminal n=1 Tax=Hymenobacter arizonensis TaxID=1227077 RepID=A0A1I6BNA6_HYMAR|nr:energy transducer TonB [Hymenobacter arizonensis]SFQ82422.1 TonB protein C-terminal [Hymenobacter arizonensis]